MSPREATVLFLNGIRGNPVVPPLDRSDVHEQRLSTTRTHGLIPIKLAAMANFDHRASRRETAISFTTRAKHKNGSPQLRDNQTPLKSVSCLIVPRKSHAERYQPPVTRISTAASMRRRSPADPTSHRSPSPAEVGIESDGIPNPDPALVVRK